MAGACLLVPSVTPNSDGASPVLPELLDLIPEGEGIATVTADGAFDSRRCHTAIIDRQATPIIPVRKNGGPWKEEPGRNHPQRNPARHPALWPCIPEALDRLPARNRIEPRMRCLTAFGAHISAKDPDRHTAEIRIRAALINRFNALGTAEIVRAT